MKKLEYLYAVVKVNGAATVKNSTVVPQKTKNGITTWSRNYNSEYVPPKNWKQGTEELSEYQCSLFTIAQNNQGERSTDEWKNSVCTYIWWDIIQSWNGRKFWQHGWTLTTWC